MQSRRVLVLVVSTIVLSMQTGCASKVGVPHPSEQLRTGMGKVGVVAVSSAPETGFTRPLQSKALAALAGMGGGLAVGLGSGAACFLSAGYLWPFCGVALWTPGMMVTGVVEGAHEGVTIAEVQAGTEALRAASADQNVQDALRDTVFDAAAEREHHRSVVAIREIPPSGSAAPPVYTHLAAQGLDTVLEVAVANVNLRRESRPRPMGTYGPSVSFKSWMNPFLELVVQAHVRVIRVSDGAVLFERSYGTVSLPSTFTEWARDGAQAFREARSRALEMLGKEIAGDFFDLAPSPEPTSPAPEPEGPEPPEKAPSLDGGPTPAEQPGVVEGDLAQVVVAAGGAAVPRVHVDLEERGLRAPIEGAQLGDPLGGLPVHHLAIVQ